MDVKKPKIPQIPEWRGEHVVRATGAIGREPIMGDAWIRRLYEDLPRLSRGALMALTSRVVSRVLAYLAFDAPFTRTDHAKALEYLAMVEMDHLARVQISQLSGGQQQRVFLARALLTGGSIFLLDEPFTGIDTPTQELIAKVIGNLSQSGKTVISATHDLEQAAATSDRIVLLNRRVIAVGPPTVVLAADTLGAAYGDQFSVFSRILGKAPA